MTLLFIAGQDSLARMGICLLQIPEEIDVGACFYCPHIFALVNRQFYNDGSVVT